MTTDKPNDQDTIRERMAALTDLLLRKNRDYGSSFRQPGTLSTADPADKLIIRIEDKLARFKTLYGARCPSVASESLTDTINDLIGYFVLLGILISENTPQRPLRVRADKVVLDEVVDWPDGDVAEAWLRARGFPPAIPVIQKDIRGNIIPVFTPQHNQNESEATP